MDSSKQSNEPVQLSRETLIRATLQVIEESRQNHRLREYLLGLLQRATPIERSFSLFIAEQRTGWPASTLRVWLNRQKRINGKRLAGIKKPGPGTGDRPIWHLTESTITELKQYRDSKNPCPK